ncbi:hypothetical protein JHS3_23100 [Jeongeupia sp. HS-3]|uniref:nitrilase-related carbon-nitrogen hydrolase n=1 Tax=Jeongeupia sp. HS-3 TaxID=1009682 RepID=UPI0018A49A4F|nr:nitrilase-related carbon-nitrogen hydrolase [Jeongeupia sp. HS-3]BCL76574.1 hypothetical protein JHS3_23100 [Jeongeupia sp. HS-3]
MTGWLTAMFAAVVSGMAIRRGWGLRPVWWLAWLAPLPLLLLAATTPLWQLGIVALLAGLIGYGGNFSYFRTIMPLGTALTTVMMLACGLALLLLAQQILSAALPAPLAVFAWPLALVSLEATVARLSPHGDAVTLATTQADLTPLVQIAAVFGLRGIVFALGLGSAWLALLLQVIWHGDQDQIPALCIPPLMLVTAFAYGMTRLRRPAATAATTVTLAVRDIDNPADAASRTQLLAAYTHALTNTPMHGLIVLPEKLLLSDTDADQAFRSLARSRHSTVVVGFEHAQDNGLHNIARVYQADGSTTDYAKRCLVPGWEDGLVAGKRPVVSPSPQGQIALAVCRDLFFATSTRDYAPPAAEALVVPAWDFGGDGWVRSRLAVLRGVECGLPVLRSARNGLLTISDPYGRIIAEAPSNPEMAIVSSPLPASLAIPTAYTRWGRHFEWLCLLLTAGLLVAGLQH